MKNNHHRIRTSPCKARRPTTSDWAPHSRWMETEEDERADVRSLRFGEKRLPPQHQCVVSSKTCNVCGIEKPITEFYKHPTTKDGYKSKCKICYNGKIYRPKAKKIKKKLNKNEKYCLKCEEVFISEGMFNRICPSCKKINAGMYVSEFE